LSADGDDVDADEEPVPGNAFEDVYLVIKTTVTGQDVSLSNSKTGHVQNLLELVENLHPNINVEDQRLQPALLKFGLVTHDLITRKVQG
jgi:hypothetical protein